MADKLFDKKRRNFKVPGFSDTEVLFDPSRRTYQLKEPGGGYGTLTTKGVLPSGRLVRGRTGNEKRGGFGIVPNAAGPDFNLTEVFGNRGVSGSEGQRRTPGGFSDLHMRQSSPEAIAETEARRNRLDMERELLKIRQPIVQMAKTYNEETGGITGERPIVMRPVFGDPNQPDTITDYEIVGGDQKNAGALESFRAAAEEEAKKQDQFDSEQARRVNRLTSNPPRDSWMPPERPWTSSDLFQRRKRQAFEFAPHRSQPSVYPPVQAPTQGQISTTKLSRSRLFDKFNNPRWGLRWGKRYGVEYPNWGKDWKSRGK